MSLLGSIPEVASGTAGPSNRGAPLPGAALDLDLDLGIDLDLDFDFDLDIDFFMEVPPALEAAHKGHRHLLSQEPP